MSDPAGASFKSANAAAFYPYRAPYPAQVFDRIIADAPATGRLVDMGSGEGKIARPMTRTFDAVTAFDPSDTMIALGQTLPQGQADNLTWVAAQAETAPLPDGIDVATFASSIHWMDPVALFQHLKPKLKPNHILAVLKGDEPHAPPWHEDWRVFLRKWVPALTGHPLDGPAWTGPRMRYLDHVQVIHTDTYLSEPFHQSVADFIRCQHSRETFAPEKMGDQKAAFDQELEILLQPYANAAGALTFQVETQLTIARL